MKPHRINWKVAAVVGASTSMVGAGGFALASSADDADDTDDTTTTIAVSVEPTRASAPVVIPDEATERAVAAADAEPTTDTDASVESVSAESVSADAVPPVEPDPEILLEMDSVESVSMDSISMESVSMESISMESISAPSVSAETPPPVQASSDDDISVESVPSAESVSVESSD